jgi:hypothetical protein
VVLDWHSNTASPSGLNEVIRASKCTETDPALPAPGTTMSAPEDTEGPISISWDFPTAFDRPPSTVSASILKRM